jgi:hypothetical protein
MGCLLTYTGYALHYMGLRLAFSERGPQRLGAGERAAGSPRGERL